MFLFKTLTFTPLVTLLVVCLIGDLGVRIWVLFWSQKVWPQPFVTVVFVMVWEIHAAMDRLYSKHLSVIIFSPNMQTSWTVLAIFSKLCSRQVLVLNHLKCKTKICYSIACHCWDSSTSIKDSSSIRHSQFLCIATNKIWFALQTWRIHKVIITALHSWLRWS